jgi:hypothetical protein
MYHNHFSVFTKQDLQDLLYYSYFCGNSKNEIGKCLKLWRDTINPNNNNNNNSNNDNNNNS